MGKASGSALSIVGLILLVFAKRSVSGFAPILSKNLFLFPRNLTQMEAKRSILPKAIVFDLDGCLWRPEMYELSWGRREGPPFALEENGTTARTRNNTPIRLIADVPWVLDELYSNEQYKDISVAVSSRTDEPDWARELLDLYRLPRSQVSPRTLLTGPIEISYEDKTNHMRRIARAVPCELSEMLFFDNEYGNCRSVSSIGVTVAYTPDGVTRRIFEQALSQFPSTKIVNGR